MDREHEGRAASASMLIAERAAFAFLYAVAWLLVNAFFLLPPWKKTRKRRRG